VTPTPAIRKPRRRAPPSRHLVAKLLEWRDRRGLITHCALPEQKERPDVWTLCEDYGDDDYDAMDEDEDRNAAYSRAFAAVSPTHKRWLEIGCGASAMLTRLALDAAPNALVTAFEVNPKSAEAARRRLASIEDEDEDEGAPPRFEVLTGRSTQPELVNPMLRQRGFGVVLHEVFGLFASSEGCARMLAHARSTYLSKANRYSPKPLLIPARCATFFTACWLRPRDLGACETVSCSAAPQRRPKLLLAPAAPLARMALCARSCCLEAYDFAPDAPELQLVQRRSHELHIARAGELNCLGCFLWVDLGIGEPALGDAAPPPADDDDDDGPFDGAFPFGDESALSLLPTLAAAAPGQPRSRLNDFTSLCCDETQASHTYASNWQNPLLLLPRPARVAPGDTVRVVTRVDADSLRPTYHFEATLHRAAGGGEVSLGRLEVSLDDLYPDMGDL